MMSELQNRHHSSMPSDDQQRPILEVCEELGIQCTADNASGRWHSAICPVHDDNNASLRINARENFWHCFGCNRGGSVAHLWAWVTGCSLNEAIVIVVRHDADLWDHLGTAMDEQAEDATLGIVALNLLLAARLRDPDDDTVDVAEWCRVLCESADETEVLTGLRSVV